MPGEEPTPEEQGLQEELRRREAESQSEIPPPGEQPPADDRLPVITMFVVFQDPEGQWFATGDLSSLEKFAPQREAAAFDFIPACSKVISDITIMNTVQSTIVGMMQTQAQLAEQERQQKMIARLQNKGIHLPPRG